MRAKPGWRDYAELLALGTMWGGNFLLIKIGVATVPPATLAVVRLVIAAAVVGVLARLAGESFRFPRSTWPMLLLASITGNALPFILIGWGQSRIEAGLAAICMAIMPLSTILLAHFATRDDRLTAGKLAGLGFGLAGLVALVGPDKLTHLTSETAGLLAVCAGAFCYSINALVTRHLRDQPLRALAAVTLILAAIIDLPVALLFEQPWTVRPSWQSMAAIIALAAIPTGLGTLQMFRIIKRLGASYFSQINFLVPVTGVFLGALLLGERLPLGAFLALRLILIGLALSRTR